MVAKDANVLHSGLFEDLVSESHLLLTCLRIVKAFEVRISEYQVFSQNFSADHGPAHLRLIQKFVTHALEPRQNQETIAVSTKELVATDIVVLSHQRTFEDEVSRCLRHTLQSNEISTRIHDDLQHVLKTVCLQLVEPYTVPEDPDLAYCR